MTTEDFKDYIISFQVLGSNINSSVQIVSMIPTDTNPVDFIANIARTSYMNNKEFDAIPKHEKNLKLFEYLFKNKHTSPLEFVEFVFYCDNISLPTLAQWARHRTWSFITLNEVSRRYTTKDLQFIKPNIWHKRHETNKQSSGDELNHTDSLKATAIYNNALQTMLQAYHELLDLGIVPEEARYILPQSLTKNFYVKVNLHNLLHFISLRHSTNAQIEIRMFAEALEQLLKYTCPEIIDAYHRFYLDKGIIY